MQLLTKQIKKQSQKKLPKLEKLQYQILEYSGLIVDQQIYSRDIQLIDDSWMHEITCGFNNKQHIVLLHGYGGCSLTYIRLFKLLSKKYHVHALDHMGMALSGRRPFSDKFDQTEMVDYFVDAIYEWKQRSGIKSFTLVGHSFGGYMAAAFATKYPEGVERLILISPVGTKYTTKQQNQKQFERIKSKGSFSRKMFLSAAQKLIGWEITPSRILNWMIFGNLFLNRAVQGRLKLKDKQADLWKQFFRQASKTTPTSQVSFWRLFYMPEAGATYPILRMLTESKLPFKTEFYYGDNDWMEKKTAYNLANEETFNQITYTTVENAGHQVIFDNPELVASYIMG